MWRWPFVTRSMYLRSTFDEIAHIFPSSSPRGDYCETPCADRVPKMSAKSVTLLQTGTSATLHSPPPPAGSENLELSSQVGLQISKCHFTPPPPAPIPSSEKLADLELSSQVGFLDFRFQTPPPPPAPRKCKVGISIQLLQRDASPPWWDMKVYHLPYLVEAVMRIRYSQRVRLILYPARMKQ